MSGKRKKSFRIFIIGSGNVATHIGKALFKSGHTITGVYSQRPAHARKLASHLHAAPFRHTDYIPESDFILIAVKDDAIPEVVKNIGQSDAIVLHTAGSVDVSILKSFKKYGALYPLQTLSVRREVPFKNVPLCIEGSDPDTERQIELLAASAGSPVYKMNSAQRLAAHTAAVFACNFTNFMYAQAEEILKAGRLNRELLFPLIEETAAKVKTMQAKEAQTGPALRHDQTTMNKHKTLLKKKKEQLKLYQLISAMIAQSSGQ
ncbi:MAG: DUF2520 domain-containing protein [Bacteroidia bacterium]